MRRSTLPPGRSALIQIEPGRIGLWVCLGVAASGCAEPAPFRAELEGAALVLRCDQGLGRVQVQELSGAPLVTQEPASPVALLELRVPWQVAGAHRVVGACGGQSVVAEVEVPSWVLAFDVEASSVVPHRVAQGERWRVAADPSGATEVDLVVTARRPGTLLLVAGVAREEVPVRAGDRVERRVELTSAGPVELTLAGATLGFEVEPVAVRPDARVEVGELVFPAETDGGPDPSRAPWRLRLPTPLEQRLVGGTWLGFRPRDPELPWASLGVVLQNHAPVDLAVLVSSAFRGPGGAAVEAFQPRRFGAGTEGEGARAVVWVPAGGTVRAVLPVFVDLARLPSDLARVEVVVEAHALGTELRSTERRTLGLDRRDPTLALVAALGLSGAGWAWLAWRLRRGLGTTAETLAVGLLSTLVVVVGAVGQVLSVVVTAVLGPLAFLVTALPDQVVRTAVLSVLIARVPRPGVAGLAVATSWFLQGVALGNLGLVEALYTGQRVLWLELLLALAGVTTWARARGPQAWRRGLALSLAGALSAFGMVQLLAVFARLEFAGWYVALLVAGPGFLYVWLGVWSSRGLVRSLESIEA